MRWPPRRVVVVSLAVAATLPGDALLYAVLPVVWQQLGLELWMVGVLLSANRFVRLATNALAGRLVERTGIRAPFVAAIFATVVVTAAYGLVSGFAALLAVRVVWGLLWSFLRLGGFLAALATGAERRGFALGFYNGAANLGTLFGMAVGAWMTDQLGFHSAVLALAAIALPAGVFMLREPRDDPAEERQLTQREPAVMPPPLVRWPVYAGAFVTGVAASPLVIATLGLWLAELHGDSISLGGIAIGIATLNGALLGLRFSIQPLWAPAAGHLSDRFGRVPFAAGVGLACVAGMLGLSVAGSLAWTVSMAIVVFFAGIALRVSCDALAGDAAPPAARARFMSLYANAADLGSAVGPFVAYPLAELFGTGWVYQAGAALLGVGGTLVLVLVRRAPRSGG